MNLYMFPATSAKIPQIWFNKLIFIPLEKANKNQITYSAFRVALNFLERLCFILFSDTSGVSGLEGSLKTR